MVQETQSAWVVCLAKTAGKIVTVGFSVSHLLLANTRLKG